MAKGASVYKNTGCDGKTDLCFKYKGEIYEIDVKLAAYVENSPGVFIWRHTNSSIVKPPVYPLLVVPATGTDLSGWYCKWIGKKHTGPKPKPNCPPGLENFWN